jgi:hypothetical protein
MEMGTAEGVISVVVITVEASYTAAYLAHVPLETRAATAA